MPLVDFMLNVAGLLIWVYWRQLGFTAKNRGGALSLSSVLRPMAAASSQRWVYLFALGTLLLVRTLLYWQIGPAAGWTPALNLGAIALPFRSDYFLRMLLFSFVSFGQVLGVFYFWLLLFSVVNRRVPDTEPIQRLVRLHLGWFERWPVLVKSLGPGLLAAGLWMGVNPWLARMGFLPQASSSVALWQQGVLLGLAIYLAWQLPVVVILLLHLVNSYLYLGSASFWSFIGLTARNLLTPLRVVPLQQGRVDFAPLVGIALASLLTELGRRHLPTIYAHLPL